MTDFRSLPITNPVDITTDDTLPAVTSQPPAAVTAPPRIRPAELTDRFARLLGRNPGLPPADWRAVGDPEVLTQVVANTVQWMERAVVYRSEVPDLPDIPHVYDPHVGDRRPAAGSRSVFDACIAGHQGGLSPSQIKSAWDQARREVTATTLGAPGYRGMR